MADWFNIVDAQVDPDAPLTSELAYAWRDNVIAAMQGSVGAPRLARKVSSISGTVGTASSSLIVIRQSGYSGAVLSVSTFFSGTANTIMNATLWSSSGGSSWSPFVEISSAGYPSAAGSTFSVSFDFNSGFYFSSVGGFSSSGFMPSYPSGADRIRVITSAPSGSGSFYSSALVEYTGGHAP